LKSTGKIIASLFVLLYATAAYSADITISAGRNVIGVGENTTLTITVQGGFASIAGDVPVVQGLLIDQTGQSSSLQSINGKSSAATSFTFRVYGEREGAYTIPPIKVKTLGRELYTQPVSITVKKGAQGTATDSGIKVFCDVELSRETCYSGQPVMLRYFIYHTAGAEISVHEITEKPVTDGFIVKQVREEIASADSVKQGLNLVKSHVITYCMIPEISGDRNAGGGSMLAGTGNRRSFFSRTAQSRLLFPVKKLKVLPLPAKGRPAGFGGDVGEFKLEAELKGGQYMANREIQVPVTITGRGNFFVMSKPQFENTEGIKVLVEESDPELVLEGDEIAGTKKFLVTIIPQAEGSFKPGALALKYFNPVTCSYAWASSEPFSLEVSGIAAPAVEKTESPDKPETGLPVIAYLAAGALIAAAVFGLAYIIIRERRRYAGLTAAEYGKTETVQERKPDPVNFLRDELAEAHNKGDSDRLVKLCYRGLDILSETPAGKNSPELVSARARLDAARFANAPLSAGELEEIYAMVTGMLKHSASSGDIV
jgi:hypothetical protein